MLKPLFLLNEANEVIERKAVKAEIQVFLDKQEKSIVTIMNGMSLATFG